MSISNDELFELFSWLPAKSLYKFAAISKTCLNLLFDNYFIEKQCRNMLLKSEDTNFILQENSCLRSKVTHLQLDTLPESKHTNSSYCSSTIPKKPLKYLLKKGRILSSSNGLLLGCTTSSRPITKLFLCNPVTKTWLQIKLPNKELARSSLEHMDFRAVLICDFVKFPFDYKILLFVDDQSKDWSSEYLVYVYNNGKWIKEKHNLNTGPRDLNFKGAVNCQDGFYFVSDCGNYLQPSSARRNQPYVFCYDLKSGSSRTLAIPFEAGRDYFEICNLQIFGWKRSDRNEDCCWCYKSILLVKSVLSNFVIWALEDTKDAKSWRFVTEKDIQKDLGITDSITYYLNYIVTGNKLIFATDKYVYRYCFEGKNSGDLQEICEHSYDKSCGVQFDLYSDTLRPCAKYLK